MSPLNKRLHKGEAAAFAELYDQLGEKLFKYIYYRVGSRQDATDVVQEVFVRLVKSHRALGRAENINGYVFATARNETIRWLKKNKRHQSQDIEEANAQTSAQHSAELSVDGNDWVNSVLQILTAVDREIVQLKVISKLTFKEIATAIQMPHSNVATRYRRAITKLQFQLSHETKLSDKNNDTVTP